MSTSGTLRNCLVWLLFFCNLVGGFLGFFETLTWYVAELDLFLGFIFNFLCAFGLLLVRLDCVDYWIRVKVLFGWIDWA